MDERCAAARLVAGCGHVVAFTRFVLRRRSEPWRSAAFDRQRSGLRRSTVFAIGPGWPPQGSLKSA